MLGSLTDCDGCLRDYETPMFLDTTTTSGGYPRGLGGKVFQMPAGFKTQGQKVQGTAITQPETLNP